MNIIKKPRMLEKTQHKRDLKQRRRKDLGSGETL